MTQTLALGSIDIAKMAVSTTNSHFVILEIENNGSSSRWSSHFPSLTGELLEHLMSQNTTFLKYGSRDEAIAAFERLTLDCGQEGIGVMTGEITLVTVPLGEDYGYEVIEWELDEDTRPVWDGREWNHETIVERI